MRTVFYCALLILCFMVGPANAAWQTLTLPDYVSCEQDETGTGNCTDGWWDHGYVGFISDLIGPLESEGTKVCFDISGLAGHAAYEIRFIYDGTYTFAVGADSGPMNVHAYEPGTACSPLCTDSCSMCSGGLYLATTVEDGSAKSINLNTAVYDLQEAITMGENCFCLCFAPEDPNYYSYEIDMSNMKLAVDSTSGGPTATPQPALPIMSDPAGILLLIFFFTALLIVCPLRKFRREV